MSQPREWLAPLVFCRVSDPIETFCFLLAAKHTDPPSLEEA